MGPPGKVNESKILNEEYIACDIKLDSISIKQSMWYVVTCLIQIRDFI